MTVSVGESVSRCFKKFGEKVADVAASRTQRRWQNAALRRVPTGQGGTERDLAPPAMGGARAEG